MSRKRFLTALALVFGIGLIGLTSLLTPTAGAAPADSAGGLESEIIEITPIVEPGDDIEVSVLVRNSGEEVIKDGALELRFRSAQLISRSSIEIWEQSDDEESDQFRTAGKVVTRTNLKDLAPGEERRERLKISTDQLYLPKGASQWGPRGIAVDSVIDDEVVAQERTFVIWFPANYDSIFPTQLSVLAPLTGTPPGMEDGLDEGERMQNLLDATRGYDVAFALDPQLLTESENSVGLPQLEEALAGKEIFALPHFDADVLALAHRNEIDAPSYLDGARTTISSELGVTASDVLLWPEGNADADLASWAVTQEAQGVSAIVTNSNQLAPISPLTYTPSGRARVVAEGGVVPALIAEESMSTTLTAAATAGVTSSTATARQRLLADSAVITQERPADPRHVLLTVPRNWNPDPERTAELLAALADAPWINFEAVRSLIGAPAGDIEREPLPAGVDDPAIIEAELLKTTNATAEQIAQFRSIVPQPDRVLPLADAQLKGIIANGWRRAPQERADLVAQVSSQAQELHDSVHVIPAGTVNLISDAGEIPVLINNDFPQDAQVTVRLHTDSSFLKTDEVVTAQLPAESETSILVPVEGIGNRNVDVAVELENSNGTAIGTPQTITVRVRAGWEDAGTRVVAAILVVLFIIGIIRTIRRGRKRKES